MSTETEQATKTDGAAPTEGASPTTNEHVNAALGSMKQIPKKEELHAFSLDKLFSGRLDRMNYIYALIAGLIVSALLYKIMLIGAIVGLILGVIGIAATARRFRDINISGWFALLGLIPVVGLVVAVYLCITEQVNVGNRYGAAPDPKRPFFYAILNL